jgi:phage-related holin
MIKAATWMKTLLFSMLAFLLPVKPLLIGAMVMTAIDLVTGLMAARKRGERISSGGLVRTVTKSLVYSCAIIAGFTVEKLMLDSIMPVAKFVAGAIGIFEMKSVLENVSTVLGVPIFKALMDKLGSKNDPRKVEGKEESGGEAGS